MYIVDILIKKNISTKGMINMFVMMGIVFALSIIMVPMLYLKWLLAFIYFAHVVGLTWYFKIHPQKIKLKQTKKDLENS